MTPRYGMYATCAVLGVGGLGLITAGLLLPWAGHSTAALGCLAVAIAIVGAAGIPKDKS